MSVRGLVTRALGRDDGTKARQSPSDRALAAAAELVAADRDLDAIQLLSEANHQERDGRIERRLVDLRFGAFRRIQWPDPPAAAPDVPEDHYPGQLIPEVDAADLTVDRLRSAIHHHGSLIVRGLVGGHHVDRLTAGIDSAFDAFDAFDGNGNRKGPENGAGAAGPGNWYTPVELQGINDTAKKEKHKGGGMYAVESPAALFDLIEIFTEVGLGEVAREYLGESPMILARKVTLRRMPRNASGGWHQDGSFMGEELRALNVWLALSDCGVDAPSLDVVGRRIDYIVETGGHSDEVPYAVGQQSAEQVGEGAIVRPIFEAGDALIFDHLCLHRTGGGPEMTKGRYAIETWFMAPSTYDAMTKPVEHGFQPFDQQPLVF